MWKSVVAFCFDNGEKSSGSTTSHSDLSPPEYESFHFDLLIDPLPPVDRSDSQHEEFADELAHIISPPEYDHFYFDLKADQGELTILCEENISKDSTKELTINELNDFPLESLLLTDPSEIKTFLSFPSGNEEKFSTPEFSLLMEFSLSRENLHIY
ncbi:hypothetical protein Tco_0153800 [Tanacetum coccineum]